MIIVINFYGENEIMETKITPGQEGLPPKKNNYTPEEKSLIVAKAAALGTRCVAEAYQMDWHQIAAWKKYYGQAIKSKAPEKQNAAVLILQSPSGQEITLEELKIKIGTVDKAYIRVDEGKAYWVNGQETGAINLWD